MAKDKQLVLRLPAALMEAIKAHQGELQKAAPFGEAVSTAEAARDLLRRGLQTRKKRR